GGQGLSATGGGASAREGMDLGRALHRGWNVAGSVGQRKEFSTERQEKFTSTGRPWKSHSKFSWGEAIQPDARIDEGAGGTAGGERTGQGGQVELQRESAGGEPQRIDCGQPGVGSHGHGRTLCRAGHAAVPSRRPASDGGRRQGF